ncbi:MAG: ATP-binding protein [Candidatus Viridilinea halotolerans]|uniref:ATP-binding protein n=1 Tax=Candidatus Viridilinea halotolerans TaxID=2491704 RepID=A0A426TV06_9CHLR|nr:MAG: ATP-binding protein [Candidatus Viridilinea halotolerans]
MMRLLLDRGRPTVVVHGPRRFGKSSFLRQLPRLLPIDVVYAFESAQNSAFRESDRGFCFGLARALYRDSQAAGLALAAPERRDFREEPFGALDDYLDQLEQQLGERSLLLALDEFELIGQALETGSLSLRVLDHLRYMIQHRSRLALIFGGLNTLAELGPNWTNYFINVQPLEMLYLTPQAARDLLENPDPQFNLRYEASVVEEILCLTRCQPYLLQAMGAAMVNLANRAKWQTFPLAQLSAASDEALQAGAIYFQELWNNYTGTNADEVRAGRAILRALAAGQPPPEPADASEHNHQQQALARLLRYHLVERSNGGYQIEIPLVAQWVRERAVD